MAGQSLTATQGTVSIDVAVPLKSRKRSLSESQLFGSGAILSQGTLRAYVSRALTGQSLIALTGSLASSEPFFHATIPDHSFTQGVASSFDITPYMTNFNSASHQIALASGTLPSGITIDETGSIDYDGVGAVASASSFTLDIVSTARADFLARAASASFATDWSDYTTATEAYNSTACFGANKLPSSPTSFNNSFEIVSTAGHVTGGKALRIYHGKTVTGGNIDYGNWGILFNGGSSTGAKVASFKTSFYCQVTFWCGDFFNYLWKKGDGSVVSPKVFILDADDVTATTGEVVLQNSNNQGFPTVYRYTSTGSSAALFEKALSSPANGSDFKWQCSIDRGTPSNTSTAANWYRRYGPHYSSQISGLTQSSLLSEQGVPNPDAAIGGVVFPNDGLLTVEVYCDLATDRCKVWAAPYGETPIKIHDSSDSTEGTALFGTRVKTNGTGWNAIHLTNLAFNATEAQNTTAGLGSSAWYTDYSEVLISASAINFPGGFSLPA